ncbi:MAG: HAD family hydrolase [Deltaproteobacteria bacterium]|nr:HAD family hydrolase [Deltaproteobacteria bacterium]
MSFRAVIFDLDGTLLDTLEDLADSVNRTLAANGFPTHPVDAYRYFVGDGSKMLITRALPPEHNHPETVTKCFEAFRNDYRQYWKVKTKPFEGIPEMLQQLTELGVKMAILSNKPHEFTRQCVAELLTLWSFEPILGQRETVPLKPDPTGALEIVRQLDRPSSDFLYLGDSAVDMQTATAAGIFPVGACWGFRTASELQESGAKVLIEKPTQLIDLML